MYKVVIDSEFCIDFYIKIDQSVEYTGEVRLLTSDENWIWLPSMASIRFGSVRFGSRSKV